MSESLVRIERRSLAVGMWANLGMGVAGVAAAWLSRSDALLVDGLYSAVNFLSAIVAGRVAETVHRPPDRQRPFGYEANESLYVTFRSLVLIGILSYAALDSGQKILEYLGGAPMPTLVLGPIAIYVTAMVVLCFSLAAWHRRAWRLSGRQSELLRVEARAAFVDGVISAGAGAVLLAAPLMDGTVVAPVVPIVDAVVVLALSAAILPQPIATLVATVREIAGEAAPGRVAEKARRRTAELIAGRPYELLEVSVSKLGRYHWVIVYLAPTAPVEVAELDALRAELRPAFAELYGAVRSEIVVTAIPPYEL